MNLYDAILVSRPTTAFKLNGAGTSYDDISGRAVALTPASTLAFTPPVISGGVPKSMNAINASRATFSKGLVYKKGYERQSWSMEIWAGPRAVDSGVLDLISNAISTSSPQDGLWIDSDFIHFTVEFNTLGRVDLKWPMPDALEEWHIVGVYTPAKVQLYINGEVVDEADISDEQIADGFKYTDATFNVGRSSGTIGASVDGIAVYSRALTDAEIYRHFVSGRRMPTVEDIAAIFGGNSFNGTHRDIFSTKQWYSRDDWILESYEDIDVESGDLRPIEDPVDQTSMPGEWTAVYETAAAPSNLYGVQIDWDGDGDFVVEASLDSGDSWVSVENGRVVDGTFNWDSTDINVLIRVSFTGGVVSDPATVRRLRVVSFLSPTVYGTDVSRSLTVTDGVSTLMETNEPIEFNIFSGLRTESTDGSIVINPDIEDEEPRDIGSLEFWVRFNGTQTSKYIFDSRPDGGTAYVQASGTNKFVFTGGTLYINKVSISTNTTDVLVDTWYHVVFVFTTPIATAITIPADGSRQYAVINAYPAQLTSGEVSTIYGLYSGYPSSALATESNPVSEELDAYHLYSYDWAIQPVGS